MKKLISAFIAAAMLLSVVPYAIAGSDINIYVSVNGSDATGDGSAQNPYASIISAKNAAAELSKTAPVNVIFSEGIYPITGKVLFKDSDSGTESCPITYKAADGKRVIFSGAVTLDNNEFEKIEIPDILKRIPESARSKVVMFDLSEHGISYNSIAPILYVNDVQQTIARYPNYGFVTADTASGITSFEFDYDNVSNWKSEKIQLVGNLESGYRWKTVNVSGISGKTLSLTPYSDSSSTIRNGASFFVRNLIEEIDAPGEYAVENDILYYYPIGDIADLKIEAAVFNNNYMIHLDGGASNITFEGITFEKSLSGAIGATSSEEVVNINITNCSFRNMTGSNTIYLAKGKDCTISDNYAYGSGGRFIYFKGGARENLEPGNIVVANNRIVSAGNWNLSVSGTIATGENSRNQPSVKNTVRNNIIQDSNNFSGIDMPGNDNVVQYNEILNQGRVIEDGGAIYFGRSSSKYGSDVSYNYIHDLNLDNYYCALYSDDGYSGLSMHHNVIYNVGYGMISGMGMNNSFNNNLLIKCSNGFNIGTRMSRTSSVYQPAGDLYQETYDVTRNPDTDVSIRNAYNAAYPTLQGSLDRTPYFAPWNSEVTGNVSFGTAKAIYGTPNHSYYDSTGKACLIEGEGTFIGDITTAFEDGRLRLYGTKPYVNELKTYGKEVTKDGIDLNGTTAGNPTISYTNSYFENAAEQNYTLTKQVSDVSTVHEIDMTEIGIEDTTNPDIFELATDEVYLYEPAVDSNMAVIAWENVEKASKYKVVVSTNADLSSPVSEEEFYNLMNSNYYTFNHGGNAGKYYYKVTAYGISRQDMFTLESCTGEFTVYSLYTKNLSNALSILKGYIDDMSSKEDSEGGTLTDMNELYNRGTLALTDTSLVQSDIDNLENEVYDTVDEVAVQYRITRFEPDLNSTTVYVEGRGFESNSLVSALVTNPETTFEEAIQDQSVSTIRYMDTVKADANGKISFSFDTSVNDIDYTGTYNLYVTDSRGVCIERTYSYGTVELSAVEVRDGDTTIEMADLVNYKGKTLTMHFNITNRRTSELKPCISICAYENGSLKNVALLTDKTIEANSKASGLIMEYTVPEDYSDKTEIRFLVWDENITMTPLTKVRIINEK